MSDKDTGAGTGAGGAGGGHPAEEDRRDFMKTVGVAGVSAGLGAVVAVPAIGCLAYPLGHTTVTGGEDFLPAGKLKQLESGEPIKVELYSDKRDAWNRVVDVKVGSAWLIKEGDEVRAYSTVCPHLGCAVDYDGEAKKFKCPCHTSIFSATGEVEHGPSPRPMDTLEVKTEEDVVAVRYQRFKQGVSEKETI